MPHEILSRNYLFQPRVEKLNIIADANLTEALLAEMKPTEEPDSEFAKGKVTREPMVHNFRHDVECVWWIMLWTPTGRVDHDLAKNFSNAVFQTTLTLSPIRHHAFNSGYTESKKDLEDVLPPSLSRFAQWMVLMRRDLVNHYE